MPGIELFKKGFNLHRGVKLGDYKLTDISMGHETITRYREYRYPMHLTFEGGISSKELPKLFQDYVAGEKIINSEYGNPYKCYIDSIEIISSNVTSTVLSAVGHSFKV